MKLSVVLPTYNEAKNIVPLVSEIRKQVTAPWACEIIVVDDDSPDGTYDAIRIGAGDDPGVKVIRRESDHGLAKSIRTGLEKASGDYVLVMDTDFTHRPDEIPLMLHVVQKVDLVSGSRFCAGGLMDDTRHYIVSFVYNLLIRLMIRTQVQDNLGGFWVARTEVIRRLPFDDIFFGYGDYYVRMLHYLQANGATIVEVPAHYTRRTAGKSKSNFLKLLFGYSREVAALALKRK